ncbi:MAG: hypothetical protein JWM57_1203 [Phycisphaerales bacterium]|nr:hypothetical protein [Phycisphaerales bacterium]
MSKSQSIRSPRRSGYMLTEMIVTIALISLAAGMATQLIIRIFDTGYSLQAGEQEGLAAERAVARLRQDVERASTISLTNDAAKGATLNLGSAVWSSESNALIRTAGGQIDRFESLPAAPALAAHDGMVTLHVGDADWAFAPLADVATGGTR